MICEPLSPVKVPFGMRKAVRFLVAVTVISAFVLIAKKYTYTDDCCQRAPSISFPKEKRNTIPVILLWNSYFSDHGKWLPAPISFNCSMSDCIVTNNRVLLPKSSAIILHFSNVDLNDLPKYRTPSQRWILFNMESPAYNPKKIFAGLSGKINWTATYRKDSDLHTPYGWIIRRKTPGEIPTPPANRKLVCWLVSHCSTSSGREIFVRKLRKFVPVDIYGRCGQLRCSMQEKIKCYRALSRKYKFYLSFENSICKDYTTEKLFNALRTDMVPVVMGGGNYSDFLPPHSYIDALSFDGPQQLAEYLLELDKDENKYLSYFAWKKNYEAVDAELKWSCDLCRKLHSDDTKSYGDLLHWWFDEAKCSSVAN